VRGMYAALRLQAVQWSVTRPPGASSALDRSGFLSTATEPHEGQTKGFWSRSAAIRTSASGARYSLTPRRPTVGPSGGIMARNWHPHPKTQFMSPFLVAQRHMSHSLGLVGCYD